MKIAKATLLTIVFVAASSCTVFKKTTQSYTTPAELAKPEAPSNIAINEIEFVTPPTTVAGSADFTPRTEPVASVPLSDFTNNELEHIKFSNYNPFPDDGNTFSVDLDKSRDAFTFPVESGRFSSGYGRRGSRMHTGTDILGAAGTPVHAAFDGVVRLSKPYSGYGNVIVLRHNNGLETVYSHNAKNLVKPGQVVKSGDKIATVGRTGQATTNHVHFEVRVMGQTINPALMLDLTNNTLQRGLLTIKRSGSTITATNVKNKNVSQPPVEKEVATKLTEEAKTVDSETTAATTPPTREVSKYHTIKKGDTLYALALKYDTSVSSICKLNKITAKTTLALGRKLLVK